MLRSSSFLADWFEVSVLVCKFSQVFVRLVNLTQKYCVGALGQDEFDAFDFAFDRRKVIPRELEEESSH